MFRFSAISIEWQWAFDIKQEPAGCKLGSTRRWSRSQRNLSCGSLRLWSLSLWSQGRSLRSRRLWSWWGQSRWSLCCKWSHISIVSKVGVSVFLAVRVCDRYTDWLIDWLIPNSEIKLHPWTVVQKMNGCQPDQREQFSFVTRQHRQKCLQTQTWDLSVLLNIWDGWMDLRWYFAGISLPTPVRTSGPLKFALRRLITLEIVTFNWFQWEFKLTNIYENIWMPLQHNPHLLELLEHWNLFTWVNHTWNSHVILIPVRIQVNQHLWEHLPWTSF